jgi:hypothetical protein
MATLVVLYNRQASNANELARGSGGSIANYLELTDLRLKVIVVVLIPSK